MGYGSVYGNRMISYLRPREVKFLDRLFLKALARTRFGSQLIKNEVLVGSKVVAELNGAQRLYQEVGASIFGDNEFAFRRFSDAREYTMPIETLEQASLLNPSGRILRKLKDSIDNALVEVERRCTPSEVKPDAVYEDSNFRNGAWQLYREVSRLVGDILPIPTMRDRRTIKRKFLNKRKVETKQFIVFNKRKVA
ncbi:MAG TPA: hypothetical protein VJB94_05335 [Candidatus Nanoarchaeia archaeon]|nr:hypothetical protein [Candidatus Nanoarchaeia archaeon]